MKRESCHYQVLRVVNHSDDMKEVDLDVIIVCKHNEELDNETNRKMKMIFEQSCHHSPVQSVDAFQSLLNEQMNQTF